MNLNFLIQNIQQQRLGDSDAALKNIANSEKYLQQAYEGRYLFELIQNVRDANKEAKMIGSVFIELKDETLIISNTGSPFSERGINSITTIGDSPKESQEFIGFKGIGFKSVHEISDTPTIITEWGSIIFDKVKNVYAGCTSFANISNKDKRAEIGWTWIGKDFQKTGLNRHCKFLLLRYMFEHLGFERVEFRTDERNIQSRTAMEKMGAKYEGALRSHTLMNDGFRRTTVYYSILKEEWNKLRTGFLKN